jgi:hypothetical protein
MLSEPPALGRWTGSPCWVSRSSRSWGIALDELLARRFASFRTIYLPTAGRLLEAGFELLATGQRPHYTVQLRRADDPELEELLAALGAARSNPQYGRSSIRREEG